MRRFFVVAVTFVLAACMGDNAWSQSGGGGGGGGSGGAGGAGAGAGATGGAGGASAGTAGGVGAAGTTGTAGTAGAAGTAGGSSRAGAAGTAGTAGAAANNRGIGPHAQAGANGQMNNPYGFGRTPFFADPGARQQLGLNNNQYNQLNRAYQQALQRYNTGAVGQNGSAAGATAQTGAAASRAAANANGQSNLTIDGNTDDRRTPNDRQSPAAERRAERLQNLQARRNANATQQRTQQPDRFGNRSLDNDFDGVVDSTFTDPAMRQRFNQLNWQYQGPAAFNNRQIQQQLNLTAQQRQQLRSLAGEWRQQLLNARRDNRTNLTAEQFEALRNRFNQRLNTVLTPEQQRMWTQMIGEPYDFPVTAYFPQNAGRNASRVGIGTGVQQTGDATRTTRRDDSDNVAIEPYGGRSGTGSSANWDTQNSDSGTRR